VTDFAKNLSIYTLCETSKPTKITASHIYWWLLPNDVIYPPEPSPTNTNTHIQNQNHNRRNRLPYLPSYQYHYRNNSRSTTILLDNPHNPMYHTIYHHATTATNTTTAPHPNTGPNITTTHTDPNLTPPPTSIHTNPSPLSHASIIYINYDHDHDSFTSTTTDIPRRRLLDLPPPILPPLPLPPPPHPNHYLQRAPPQPPPLALPTQITIDNLDQEPPLPDLPEPDDFFLPDPGDSDYDTDSSTDSDSDSLASTASFPSLPFYGDLDDPDNLDLDFSDLDEDTP